MAAILADDIFKCILLNENDEIPIKLSLKLVPRSPIDNKPLLDQVMAWRRTFNVGVIRCHNATNITYRQYDCPNSSVITPKHMCNSIMIFQNLIQITAPVA